MELPIDEDPYEPYEPDYEDQYEEEYVCNYGEDEGFCAISVAEYMIEDMTKGIINKIKNMISKKRKELLEDLYGRSALRATEWCSFHCPLRPDR